LGITWLNPGFLPDDNDPVVAISWNDAVAYCRWISEETGEEYRLPSEAEWEYACLSGQENKSGGQLDSIAWYSQNSSGRTHPVATKKCNSYGLFDMLGNAWEWTSDVYHENYVEAPADGEPWLTGGSEAQRGYLKAGEGRVLRGGSWGLSIPMHPVSYDLRITSRPVFGKQNSCNNSGFRIARSEPNTRTSTPVKTARKNSFTVDDVLYEMICISPGQFIMGDLNGDRSSKPLHAVKFDKPFFIGNTEVTVKQFRSFVEHTGYITDAEKKGSCWDSDFRSQKPIIMQSGIYWNNPGFSQTENDPVTCVSWNDAMAFCRWLSRESGRRIRLPSEAEWEFAGSDTTGYYSKSYPEIAWYFENSGFTTHPVAGKKPNSNGLYDMLGNVFEWMMDIWHPDYENAPCDGSARLGEQVTARVCRGGSFERESSEMGQHGRDWYNESEVVVGSGFRIVDTGI
jgi:formylglycine-generating enzyme required for sulfatase activity